MEGTPTISETCVRIHPIPIPTKRLDIPVSLVKGSTNNKIAGYEKLRSVLNGMVDPKNKNLVDFTISLGLAMSNPSEYDKLKTKSCDGFMIGRFSPTRSDGNCVTYVPLLAFDVDKLEDEFSTRLLLEECKKCPYIFLAFPSPSRKGLRILVWCDSTLAIHTKVYNAVCEMLCNHLRLKTDKAVRKELKAKGVTDSKELNKLVKQTEHLDTSTKNVSRIWFYTHLNKEKDIYLNEESNIFKITAKAKPKPRKSNLRPLPSKHKAQPLTQSERIQICVQMAKNRNVLPGRNNGIYALACLMVEHGVITDEIINYCLTLEEVDFDEFEIRKTVNSALKRANPNKFSEAQILAYKDKLEGKKVTVSPTTNTSKDKGDKLSNLLDVEQEELKDVEEIDWEDDKLMKDWFFDKNRSTYLKIKSYLLSKYEFRKNVISNDVEYRLRDSGDPHKDLNEHDIVCEIKDFGIKSGIETDLMSILRSNLYVPKFNPIKYYFSQLPQWEEGGTDHIDKLANFVIAKDQKWFNQQFKKMIVRSAACALNYIPFNKQCFTLLGGQNAGKSTFFRFLCPVQLRNYYKENIDITSKDGELALCQNIFINFEELDALNKKELNKIKAMFTKHKVKVRPPYERRERNFPRTCNFLASSNREEILTDETGNVRWLVFEITGINHDKGGKNGYNQNINIDLVWAQALTLLRSGFKFQLTPTELAKSERNNKSYQEATVEMEWIQKLYSPANKIDNDATFIMSSDIQREIINRSNNSRISLRNVGKALRFLGFTKSQRRHGNEKVPRKGYFVKSNIEKISE